MNTLSNYITDYLNYCRFRKHLNSKTLKAYQIDLKQYLYFSNDYPQCLSKNTVDSFITILHTQCSSIAVGIL